MEGEYSGDAEKKTGARVGLSTGEPDSEVLLVSGDRVVDRVNDSRFAGTISGGQIVDGKRIATGPEVAGVHWIFESSAAAGDLTTGRGE